MALRHLWGSWMVLWLMGTQALPRGEVTVPELSSGVDGKVTLRLTALGGVLEFQLFPDHAFLAPGVHITHLGRDGADEEDTAGLRNCFYSSQKQLAAFSLCRGVQGVFHNGEDRYVVQPLQTLAGWGALGQHIVFKVGKAENVDSRAGENKEEMISQSREDKDYIRVHREHTAGKLGKKRKNKDVKWGRPGSLSTDWRNSIQEAKEHLVLDRSISERPISHAGTIPRNRQRRFVSSERFVEILLVADTSMVRFYGEDLQVKCQTCYASLLFFF